MREARTGREPRPTVCIPFPGSAWERTAREAPALRPPSRFPAGLTSDPPARLSARSQTPPGNDLKQYESHGVILTGTVLGSRVRSSPVSMTPFLSPQRDTHFPRQDQLEISLGLMRKARTGREIRPTQRAAPGLPASCEWLIEQTAVGRGIPSGTRLRNSRGGCSAVLLLLSRKKRLRPNRRCGLGG